MEWFLSGKARWTDRKSLYDSRCGYPSAGLEIRHVRLSNASVWGKKRSLEPVAMRKSSETVTKYDFRILIRTEMYFVRFRTTFSASRSVGRTVLYGSMQHFLLLDPSEGRFCTVPDTVFCFRIRQKSAIHLFCTVPDCSFCFWIRREVTLQHFYSEDARSLRIFPACPPHS